MHAAVLVHHVSSTRGWCGGVRVCRVCRVWCGVYACVATREEVSHIDPRLHSEERSDVEMDGLRAWLATGGTTILKHAERGHCLHATRAFQPGEWFVRFATMRSHLAPPALTAVHARALRVWPVKAARAAATGRRSAVSARWSGSARAWATRTLSGEWSWESGAGEVVLTQAAQAAVVDEGVARCEHCFLEVDSEQLKRCGACKHPRYCSQPCQVPTSLRELGAAWTELVRVSGGVRLLRALWHACTHWWRGGGGCTAQRAAWKAGHSAECAALAAVHAQGRRLPPSLRLTLRVLLHRHRPAKVRSARHRSPQPQSRASVFRLLWWTHIVKWGYRRTRWTTRR
jgi:hypothetical protein